MSNELLTSLLKAVSRSFYLTMRVLPGAIRPQISLAYLLARATDTVADTEMVALESRRQSLAQLRERILGNSTARLDFGHLAQNQGKLSEKVLLQRCEEALDLLAGLPSDQQARIREVLTVIISGQDLDLSRFANANVLNIQALETDADLDDYTYRVAGCVGEFWTKTCRADLFPKAQVDSQFLTNGIRFGKGLQLVNILRDIPADLRQGRCYLPKTALAKAGLTPSDLLEQSVEARFRPVYQRYLDLAESHLLAGWDYTNTLPRGQFRVRLACAWPVLIGMKTLRRLRSENVLNPDHRVKISRVEVRNLMLQTLAFYPFKRPWNRLILK